MKSMGLTLSRWVGLTSRRVQIGTSQNECEIDQWRRYAGDGRRRGLSHRPVNPSADQSSLPTPWCAKKRPPGAYFALAARRVGEFDPQNASCHAALKYMVSDTNEPAARAL